MGLLETVKYLDISDLRAIQQSDAGYDVCYFSGLASALAASHD
jgi:hypothetical protein